MEHQLVYVTKHTCAKCNRELIAHLFARPDENIDDRVRREVDERTRQAHEEDCAGRPGPEPYRNRS